jgi:hypothetical protein
VLLLFCGPAPMIGFLEKNAKGPLLLLLRSPCFAPLRC